MGTFRGVAAALAACVVLSGCASVQGGDQATTTSPVVTESPSNPWDLPIEQRPPLFDPCAEIPIEAVEQGVGGPVEEVEELYNNRPGELLSCGWKNDEVLFGALSTWKSLDEYSADRAYVVQEHSIDGRSGFRALGRSDNGSETCRQFFLTSRGTAFVSLDLIGGLSSFEGENFADSCEVLDHIVLPVLLLFPEGDFQ